MSTQRFSPIRDFKSIQWGPTLQVNLLRAAAAGVVWGVVSLLGFLASVFDTRPGVEWPLLAMPALYPIMMPFAYLIFLLPIGLVGGAVASFPNIVGLVAAGVVLMVALIVTVGDPLVWALHRARPRLVPIDRYPFVGFCLVLYVLRPQTA